MTKNKDGTITITISPEAATLAFIFWSRSSGCPYKSARKYADELGQTVHSGGLEIWNSSAYRTIEWKWPSVNLNSISERDVKELGVLLGLIEKSAAPKKLRMPDGKYAPANYRKIQYPEHGFGALTTRHILFGAISGNNVAVQEWNGAEWLPKTYTLSKIRG